MKNAISNLSEVFPAETTYFYGFPVQWDTSGFYNACPSSVEELVAMRPAVCAGPNVNIVTYARSVANDVWSTLEEDFGVPLVPRKRIISLPEEIDISISGEDRNKRIRSALKERIPKSSLVMAQPYTTPELIGKYRIHPEATKWLNDKNNIRVLVPIEYQTPEYARAKNGAEFKNFDGEKFPYPCVVKVSASSAGDGVRVCKTVAEFRAAQEAFAPSKSPILIQKYINFVEEIDVKYAIHPDPEKPFELTGHSQEITGSNGEYMGGIIANQDAPSKKVEEIFEVLKREILPKIQGMGWHGVGGVDVLVDTDGNFYFNDFNCRMTAMAAQTFQVNSGLLGNNKVLGFNASFEGTLDDFKDAFAQKARHGSNHHILNVVALTHQNGTVRMHGGALFDQQEALRDVISELQATGLQSDIFSQLKKARL